MINMLKITIKGNEYSIPSIKDSYNRRAIQFNNNIIELFKKLEISENEVDISLEHSAIKKAPAYASWYFEGHNLYYSCNQMDKFVENLYVVFKVIEFEINALLQGEQTILDFISKFSEERDIKTARKEAREILGLSPDTEDLNLINKTYKELALLHHPDRPEGNAELFKKINNAHKVLKRELS